MKYRQQFDSSDCGAACLAMIASYLSHIFNLPLSFFESRKYLVLEKINDI